jgi:hypothetical protein
MHDVFYIFLNSPHNSPFRTMSRAMLTKALTKQILKRSLYERILTRVLFPFNLYRYLLIPLRKMREKWRSYFVSVQRDATVSSLCFISLQDYSTCFGFSLHPSSGVHKTADATTGTSRVMWHVKKKEMEKPYSFALNQYLQRETQFCYSCSRHLSGMNRRIKLSISTCSCEYIISISKAHFNSQNLCYEIRRDLTGICTRVFRICRRCVMSWKEAEE